MYAVIFYFSNCAKTKLRLFVFRLTCEMMKNVSPGVPSRTMQVPDGKNSYGKNFLKMILITLMKTLTDS